MKNLPFLISAIFLLIFNTQAQAPRKIIGATKIQELGQALFNAVKQNQFKDLEQYMPTDAELKILKRRSSEDMRLVLEQTSKDSIRRNLQSDFNTIIQQGTTNVFNWNDWQVTDTKLSRRDRKNPLLFRAELKLANASGSENALLFEAVRIKGRFYLFKQMVLQQRK
jgi:hypothetical protein